MMLENWSLTDKISLDACEARTVCIPQEYPAKEPPPQQPMANNKKGKAMTYDLDFTDTSTETERTKDYLVGELDSEYCQHGSKIQEKFLPEQPRPKSPKEFVEFIKDGKFKFSKDFLNDDGTWRDPDVIHWRWWHDPSSFLRWNDPNVVQDKDGWNKSRDKMDESYRSTARKIHVLPPAEGLDALVKFSETDFTVH